MKPELTYCYYQGVAAIIMPGNRAWWFIKGAWADAGAYYADIFSHWS